MIRSTVALAAALCVYAGAPSARVAGDIAGRWVPVRQSAPAQLSGTTAQGLAASLSGGVVITQHDSQLTLDYGILQITVGPDAVLHPPSSVNPATLAEDRLRAALTLPRFSRAGNQPSYWGWATWLPQTAAPRLAIQLHIAPAADVLRLVCYREGAGLVIERKVERLDRATTIVFPPVRYVANSR